MILTNRCGGWGTEGCNPEDPSWKYFFFSWMEKLFGNKNIKRGCKYVKSLGKLLRNCKGLTLNMSEEIEV